MAREDCTLALPARRTPLALPRRLPIPPVVPSALALLPSAFWAADKRRDRLPLLNELTTRPTGAKRSEDELWVTISDGGGLGKGRTCA